MTNQKNLTSKDALKQTRLRKGRNYLIWAFVCFGISYAIYSVNIGGVIGALVSLAMVLLFIGGLGYIIAGLVTR